MTTPSIGSQPTQPNTVAAQPNASPIEASTNQVAVEIIELHLPRTFEMHIMPPLLTTQPSALPRVRNFITTPELGPNSSTGPETPWTSAGVLRVTSDGSSDSVSPKSTQIVKKE